MSLIKPASAATQNISQEFSFGYFNSFGDFVGRLTSLAFTVAAIMVIFYFIIGAFELITSQGDKGHIVSARAKIYHSIIGLVLLILVFLIMEYIPGAIGLTNFKLFN